MSKHISAVNACVIKSYRFNDIYVNFESPKQRHKVGVEFHFDDPTESMDCNTAICAKMLIHFG